MLAARQAAGHVGSGPRASPPALRGVGAHVPRRARRRRRALRARTGARRGRALRRHGPCRGALPARCLPAEGGEVGNAVSLFSEALRLTQARRRRAATGSVPQRVRVACALLRDAARLGCGAVGRRARARARRGAEATSELQALATMQCSVIAERRGKLRLALFFADEARRLAVECGDRQTEARLLNNLGGLSFLDRRRGAGGALHQAAPSRCSSRSGTDADAAQAVSSVAQIHLRLGAPDPGGGAGALRAVDPRRARPTMLEERGNAQLVLGHALLDAEAQQGRGAGGVRCRRASHSNVWDRRATSPRPGRPRAMRTPSSVTRRPPQRCTGVRPQTSAGLPLLRKGGAFVKNSFNSVRSCVLLACRRVRSVAMPPRATVVPGSSVRASSTEARYWIQSGLALARRRGQT